MLNIEYKLIRNIALVVAFLVAPVLSYGSAYMMYKQIDSAKAENPSVVRAPKQVAVISDAEKAQISAMIDQVQPRG